MAGQHAVDRASAHRQGRSLHMADAVFQHVGLRGVVDGQRYADLGNLDDAHHAVVVGVQQRHVFLGRLRLGRGREGVVDLRAAALFVVRRATLQHRQRLLGGQFLSRAHVGGHDQGVLIFAVLVADRREEQQPDSSQQDQRQQHIDECLHRQPPSNVPIL